VRASTPNRLGFTHPLGRGEGGRSGLLSRGLLRRLPLSGVLAGACLPGKDAAVSPMGDIRPMRGVASRISASRVDVLS
jgi:hypothetical protein